MGNTPSSKSKKEKKSDVPIQKSQVILETGSLTFAYNMMAMKIKNLPNQEDRAPHIKKYIEDVCKEDVRSKLIVSDFPSTLDWFNVSEALSFNTSLKGKIVVLDFWTYCCINCIHLIPKLHELEQLYSHTNKVVFLGVHSPKFENEKQSTNVQDAILRHHITHPVVNDVDRHMWHLIGASGWPTLAVIGPFGNLIACYLGSSRLSELQELIDQMLPMFDFNLTPIPAQIMKMTVTRPLDTPSHLISDGEKWWFIADSGNNRIIVCDYKWKVVMVIGKNKGFEDGDFVTARFNFPIGLAYYENKLYVCDTENHAIREIDFNLKTVKTVVGTGKRGLDRFGGKTGTEQEISSPWGCEINKNVLYFSNSGSHQIWTWDMSTKVCEVYSGTAKESHFNNTRKKAEWAQPSGICISDDEIYIADSESSSIRAINLKSEESRTIVGGNPNTPEDLFVFGDVDGALEKARLQHPLSVFKLKNFLYVSDTFNHKVKCVDLVNNTIETVVGGLKEPGGLVVNGNELIVCDSNNHCIKIVDLTTKSIKNVELVFNAPKRLLKETDTKVSKEIYFEKGVPLVVNVKLNLPSDCHISHEAPSQWNVVGEVETVSESKKITESEFQVEIKVEEVMKVQLEVIAYFCKNEEEICLSGSVIFELNLVAGDVKKNETISYSL